MPQYHVTVKYEHQEKTFVKNLVVGEEIELTNDEIYQLIVDDFYSTFSLIVVDESGKEL